MEKLLVGNLKMNILSPGERDEYLSDSKKMVKSFAKDKLRIVFCPPAVYLENFCKKIKGANCSIGAQNIFEQEQGSFTGEISAQMIKNLGADYVIIAHSERRRHFGETNASANLKIKIALQNKLIPIYCVGETNEERVSEQTGLVITKQIREGLADLETQQAQHLVIAYEPVWAIGGTVVPSTDEILEVRILIRKILADKFGMEIAAKVRVLYGGSVNAATAKQVCSGPAMDGVLVGRESLNPMEFAKIGKIISE